ncbi:MAG: glycosyltransferase family 2 protein [Bacteroidetes bacterium]|nr:glycosyltransferase family 2 protein [Bacteroidota bacterium]
MDISVVIITKNEAHIIEKTLQSLAGLFDDIIIVDSGSDDHTVSICKSFHANVIESTWEGYGKNKNKGITAARYDWILSLDADESIDEELMNSIKEISLLDDDLVFNIRFKNFFCNKWIRYGEWGFDSHLRLFNRRKVYWNDGAVHEKLILPDHYKAITLKGHILHYTVQNQEDFIKKVYTYAHMNALKYYQAGKKGSSFKKFLSPLFSFVSNYFFKLGFLDGREGFTIAKYNAYYTYLKYHYLSEMNQKAPAK